MTSTNKPTKTALITGATGLLGRQVVKAFQGLSVATELSTKASQEWTWDVKGTGFSRADGVNVLKVDLEKGEEVERVLGEVNPQVLVHCAANRFPDKVDADPEGTRVLNVEATRTLAKACASRGILLIYISTDYVFSGKPGEAPYEADAPTGPTNLYGVTKLDGEKAVMDEFSKAGKEGLGVVMRVPVLYGKTEEGRNEESAVNVLLDAVLKAQEGKNVKMDHWALRFPTNTEDVGRVCKDVAIKYLSTSEAERASLPRILQMSSEEQYTKYEMCKLFAKILVVPLDNMEANTEGNDPNASVQRPYDCHLSTTALKDIGIDVSTQDFVSWWRRELRAFRH